MDLRSELEYAGLRAALAAFGILSAPAAESGLRALFRAGRPLPILRWRLVREQLALTYPERPPDEIARLARRVYDHLAAFIVEALLTDSGDLERRVTVSPGWDPLDAAVAEGRGVIVASAHLGNFELGGRVLAGRHALLDVVKPQRNRRFDRDIQELRRAHGIHTVPMDRCAPLVLAHLRGGGVVSLVLDQDAGRGGVPIRFLDRPASAWPGAARFSMRTGCPVVPAGILRGDGGRHVLHLGRPLRPPAGRDSETVREYTQRISTAVEAFIRLEPTQWFWVHRRWKGAAAVVAAAGEHVADQPVVG